MTDLEQWLDLAEQHARLMVANHGERNIRTLRSRFHAMSAQSHSMWRLFGNLRKRYSRDELDAAYAIRVAPIIGREVPS